MVVTTRSRARRKEAPLLTLSQCVFLISVVNVVGKLADIFIVALGQMPTLLLLMNANDVNLTLAAAANVSLLRFILIGIVRRVMEDCLYFFSGRWHGKDIVNYVRQKKGSIAVQRSERLMRQYGACILLVLPGALTCFAYGMAKRGSRRRTFLFLDALGAALRVIVFRGAGKGAKRVLRTSLAQTVVRTILKYKEIALTIGGTLAAIGGGGVYYYFYSHA